MRNTSNFVFYIVSWSNAAVVVSQQFCCKAVKLKATGNLDIAESFNTQYWLEILP